MTPEMRSQLCTEALVLHDKGEPWRSDQVIYHPVAAYGDLGWLQREQDLLFRQYPLLAAFSNELPSPGSFLTLDAIDVPILLVRNGGGQVNAFINACRHRGTRLAQGCGRSPAGIVCPYHAWTYSLDGELRAIPDSASFPGVNRAERPLVRLPVVEKYGLIWVCATPGADFAIDHHLAGLAPELASYRFGGYVHYKRLAMQRKMNWKMMLDTFLEPYHFSSLHANTVGPFFVPNLCMFEEYGQHLREIVVRRSIVKARDLPAHERDILPHSAMSYVLFPNTILVIQIDHVELWRSYPLKDQPGECQVTMDFLIPAPATTQEAIEHWEKNLDIAVRTVLQEDFPTAESIQAGINSGAQSHVIFGRNEPALAHFQTQIAKSIGRG